MTEEQEVAAIPLVEERIQVSKRQVETGRLKVRVAVGEREEQVPVELAHDEVEVSRVPRNQPLSALPSVRIEGNVTIIPVVEEVVVVEKRLMLVEEIHVRRKTVSSTQTIPVRLRSEEAHVEHGDARSEESLP
ncbi:MAG TPA: YsnF/AvaK domain-containing protein [Allosphingosinicella sp.]|jgi:uncharacterized protein (TIGR02271 family)